MRAPPLRRPQSGYALYLVLVLLTLLGVFATVAITSTRGAATSVARELTKMQSRHLAESGLARAEYFLNGGDGRDLYWETDSLSENIEGFGSVVLSCTRFGLFSRLTSKGTRITMSHSLTGLVGRDVPENLLPVITLTGSVAGLLIDDKTTIRGPVVMTNGYLGRGTRKRKVAGSDKWTTLRLSPRMPFDTAPIDSVLTRLSASLAESLADSTAVRGDLVLSQSPDSIRTRKKIVVLGDCRIDVGSLKNQTVHSAGTLVLTGAAGSSGCSFVAESIAVDGGVTDRCLFFSTKPMRISGGRHDSQFLCADSVFVDEKAVFGSSTIWLSKRALVNDSIPVGGIIFDKAGTYTGSAICFADSTARLNRKLSGTDISVGLGSTFSGCIITDGMCVLGARQFHGHLWAQSVSGINAEDQPSPHFLYCATVDTAGPSPTFPLLGTEPAELVFRGGE